MLFSNFYNVSIILLVLGVLKISLIRSGFSTVITVILGCCLSYCFFENYLAVLSFVFFLLKGYVQSFFLFFREKFANLTDKFSFLGKKEERVSAEQPLKMQSSQGRIEKSNSLPIKEDTLDSDRGEEGKKEEREREEEVYTLRLNKDDVRIAADVGVDVLDVFVRGTCLYATGAHFLKHGFSFLTSCTGSEKLRRWGTRNTIGMWIGAYLLLYSSGKLGDRFNVSLKKRFDTWVEGARLASDFPEKRQEAQAVQKELEGLLNSHVFFKESVSGELLLITNEKTVEFLAGILEDLCATVKQDGFDISLIDASKLSARDKELFYGQFKSLSPEEYGILQNEYPELFRNVVLLAKSMAEPEELQNQLIALNKDQTLVYRNQQAETSQSAYTDHLIYSGKGALARVKLGCLLFLDNLTLNEMVKQVQNSPISPGYSFEQFQASVEDLKEHDKLHLEKALKNVKNSYESFRKKSEDLAAQEALNDARNKLERQKINTISNQPLKSEKEPSFSKTRGTSDDQLSLPPTPPTPWSPLEKSSVDQDWHSQCLNCATGVGAVLAISRVCIGMVRRLDYTQRWKERMVEKKVPRFLFFWVSDSKPEQVSEKSLFRLLVGISVFNLVVLYALFSML